MRRTNRRCPTRLAVLAASAVAVLLAAPLPAGADEPTYEETPSMRPETQDRRIDYVELPTTDIAATKAFYSTAFGWEFTDWGPDYVSFAGAGVDGGFRAADAAPPAGGTLIVLFAVDLEATEARVREAGATIVKGIFDFPGGRRFHFTDPTGNELAVWSDR